MNKLKIAIGMFRAPPFRGFSKQPGRDKHNPLRKGVVQENLWFRGRRSPSGTRKQERSPSGARTELRIALGRPPSL